MKITFLIIALIHEIHAYYLCTGASRLKTDLDAQVALANSIRAGAAILAGLGWLYLALHLP